MIASYPIILFAFNRPWHTNQVLNSLKDNDLSDESDLYIFIDGPKEFSSAEQRNNINEVIRITQSNKWCKTVNVQISDFNLGCRNSILAGITKILKEHEAVIVLEDDIVTSPHFLRYMNQCLTFYKEYKSVFSVSAMTLPESKMKLPKNYPYDVYVSLRQLNSGWGTWRDRWELINWDLDFVPDFLNNINAVKAYTRGGDDLIRMLQEQVEGKIDAWDVQFTYNHFKNHAVSIIPRTSYIDNIGGDGSGTHHFDANSYLRFDLSKAKKEPRLLEVIYEDSRIINSFYNAFTFCKRPLWQKAVNRLARSIGGEDVFTIKKKIYM